MSDIVLLPMNSASMTCVSNVFIDNYMIDADGEYVKIYLYLLRRINDTGAGLSLSAMADVLDHTQKDVKRALYYWERKGLLALGFDKENDINSIRMIDPNEIVTPTLETVDVAEEKYPERQEEVILYPSDVVPSEDAAGVIYMAETLLGHTLSPETIDTFYYWHEKLLLPWSLIEFIIEHCAEAGITHINYLNQTALNMSKDGIKTVDEAKHAITLRSSINFAVKKAFGISGRSLAQAEVDFITRWSVEYGFDAELISMACGRTILKTQKASFEYADSILRNWHESGVKSIEDLDRLDKNHEAVSRTVVLPVKAQAQAANRFHNFTQRSDDLSQLEKKLLQS